MARNRSIGKDEHGQISIDFLIGFGIFALAFMFVFAFILGLFVPFVSNSDELTMTADRTAEILVGDLLAVNNSNGVQSGILDASKISFLMDNVTDDSKYDTLRTDLGLIRSGNNLYSLEVIISYLDGTNTIIINSNEMYASKTGNVGQSKRFVIVRDLNEPEKYPGSMAIMKVRVW
jgi:hypothetical protein